MRLQNRNDEKMFLYRLRHLLFPFLFSFRPLFTFVAAAINITCPNESGWHPEPFSTKCYKYFDDKPRDFFECQELCETYGGTIATVTSDNAGFLGIEVAGERVVADDWPTWYWIGLYRGYSVGEWIWIASQNGAGGDGQKKSKLRVGAEWSKWAPGQPEEMGQDCVLCEASMTWYDVSCDYRRRCLCQHASVAHAGFEFDKTRWLMPRLKVAASKVSSYVWMVENSMYALLGIFSVTFLMAALTYFQQRHDFRRARFKMIPFGVDLLCIFPWCLTLSEKSIDAEGANPNVVLKTFSCKVESLDVGREYSNVSEDGTKPVVVSKVSNSSANEQPIGKSSKPTKHHQRGSSNMAHFSGWITRVTFRMSCCCVGLGLILATPSPFFMKICWSLLMLFTMSCHHLLYHLLVRNSNHLESVLSSLNMDVVGKQDFLRMQKGFSKMGLGFGIVLAVTGSGFSRFLLSQPPVMSLGWLLGAFICINLLFTVIQAFIALSHGHAHCIRKMSNDFVLLIRSPTEQEDVISRKLYELAREHRSIMARSKQLSSTTISVLLSGCLVLSGLELVIAAQSAAFGFMGGIAACISGLFSIALMFCFIRFIKVLALVGDEYNNSILQKLYDLEFNISEENAEGNAESEKEIVLSEKRKMLVQHLITYFDRESVKKQHCWVLLGSYIHYDTVTQATAMIIASLMISIFPVVFSLM